MTTLDLFAAAGVTLPGQQWEWHLHGRYLVNSSRGWPVERPHREVWHYDDTCIAATEDEARARFEAEHGPHHPHAQWLAFGRGAEIPQRKPKPTKP